MRTTPRTLFLGAVAIALGLVALLWLQRDRVDPVKPRSTTPGTHVEAVEVLESAARPPAREETHGRTDPTETGSAQRTSPESPHPFQVSGSAKPWPPAWDGDAEADVQLLFHDGFEWLAVASAELDESGRFGPLEIDVPAGTSLRAVLEGGRVARSSVDLEAGDVGGRADVVLVVEEGLTLRLDAVDEQLDRIPDSWFRLEWDRGKSRFTIEVESDESGVAVIHGARSGRVMLTAGAPGWATGKGHALELPRDAERLKSIILSPSGRLEGRCSRDGVPVRDFFVTLWPVGNPGASVEELFRDREDGTFVLENAPQGAWYVVAMLPDGERSSARRVNIPFAAGESASVELEITTGVEGRGTVVSGSDGQPIEGVTVGVHLSDMEQPALYTGAHATTDRNGDFTLPAVLRPDTILSLASPGKATAWVRGAATEDGSIDFGRTELYASQTARVILESTSALPARTYFASLKGAEVDGVHPFPPDGVLEFDTFSPGYTEITILHPPDLLLTIARTLIPGQEWVFRIPAPDSRTLELLLSGATGSSAAGTWWVKVEGRGLDGSIFKLGREAEPGQRVRIAPIPDGEFALVVYDNEGASLYRTTFSVAPGDGDLEIIDDVAAIRLNVMVRDAAGGPLPNTSIAAQSRDSRTAVTDVTGPDGRTTLVGLAPGPTLITLVHDELGSESGIEIEIQEEGDTNLDLVLPEQSPYTLRAMHDGSPMGGLTFELRTYPADYLANSSRTNQEGFVTFPRCGVGRYFVINRGSDQVWSDWQFVDAGSGEERIYEVRMLGNLQLRLAGPSGESLVETEFSLYHEQLEFEVAASVGTGRWRSSTGALRSDASGEVLLSGIPEGEYRVYYEGAKKSLHVFVLPGETTFAEVVRAAD